MLKDALKIVQLTRPLSAEVGDLLIITADNEVEVYKKTTVGRGFEVPKTFEAVSIPMYPFQATTVGAAKTSLGCLAPEQRPNQKSRRLVKPWTEAEHQAFKDLVLQALRDLGEATGPRIANHLGFFPNNADRTTVEHRTYDALCTKAVQLYHGGLLQRRAIGGGPLRVAWAYSLKEPAA